MWLPAELVGWDSEGKAMVLGGGVLAWLGAINFEKYGLFLILLPLPETIFRIFVLLRTLFNMFLFAFGNGRIKI